MTTLTWSLPDTHLECLIYSFLILSMSNFCIILFLDASPTKKPLIF